MLSLAGKELKELASEMMHASCLMCFFLSSNLRKYNVPLYRAIKCNLFIFICHALRINMPLVNLT